MLPSFPMSSMPSVSEQATAATMSKPIDQHATENRCCQCCTNDVERQHHKSRGSRLRKPIVLTIFALFGLTGLLILSCVRWNGHFSGLEFDELLPRDATGTVVGAVAAAAAVLAVIILIIISAVKRSKKKKEEEEKKRKEEEKKKKEEEKKRLARRLFKSLSAPSQPPRSYAPGPAPGWRFWYPDSQRPYTFQDPYRY